MKRLVDLFYQFISSCHINNAKPEWFNMGIHEDSLEIYTAEEHDEYRFHGSMGDDCETKEDVDNFIKAVVKQNKYYKSKE